MRRVVLAGLLLVAATACDGHSTVVVPPSFPLPRFSAPPVPTPPPPGPLDQPAANTSPPTVNAPVVSQAPPTSDPYGASLLDGLTVDPLVPIDSGFEVVAPAPPPPPVECAAVFGAVSDVVGNATSTTGGSDLPPAPADPVTRQCYGTILPPTDSLGNTHSAVFEFWTFPTGELPEPLASGNVEATTPAAFTGDPALGEGVAATAGTFVAANETSTATRAVRFDCGGRECWLYVELGAFYPPDPDRSTLDTFLAAIVDALRSGVPVPVAPSAPADLTHPTCAQLEQPALDLAAQAQQTIVFSDRDEESYDVAGGHAYLRCSGALATRFPDGAPVVFARLSQFDLFAWPDGFEVRGLEAYGIPDTALPAFGADVTAIRSQPEVVATWPDTAPPVPRQSRIDAVARFDCSAWECLVFVSQQADLPPDSTTALFDAQTKSYIGGVRQCFADPAACAGAPPAAVATPPAVDPCTLLGTLDLGVVFAAVDPPVAAWSDPITDTWSLSTYSAATCLVRAAEPPGPAIVVTVSTWTSLDEWRDFWKAPPAAGLPVEAMRIAENVVTFAVGAATTVVLSIQPTSEPVLVATANQLLSAVPA